MPSCASESFGGLNKVWPSSESIHAGSVSSTSSCIESPTSPSSLSPVSTSPDNTLRRRRRILRTTSATIIQEPFVIRSDCRDSRSQSPIFNQQQSSGSNNNQDNQDDDSFLVKIIGWYPCFLLRIVKALVVSILPRTWKQWIFTLPMLWISMWLWLITQLITLPLTIFQVLLVTLLSRTSSSSSSTDIIKKRTVLISGGNTIQALHLARNFYSAGARVVVCEIDGLFPLTRFSTAVSKFYTVPKPTSDQQQNYVRALCEIVDKEQASYYIPVCSSVPAYYDAVAKPHLELLGCTCLCPGIKEVWALDDTLEVLKCCQKFGIATPVYYTVTCKEDVHRLYDTGEIRVGRYTMSTAGPSGLRERSKMILPLSRTDLKLPGDLSEQKPWVIVRDIVEADHFLTCTTVKETQVIANVTCQISSEGLVPVDNKDINQWLNVYFSKLNLLRPITGYVSFRFVVPRDGGTNANMVLPLSNRVGVSLPYICYSKIDPRLLWKTCRRHISRQNSSTSVVQENGRQSVSFSNVKLMDQVEPLNRLWGTVLDKREILFAVWDPLPYCAYYHMLLPFKNMLGFVQKRQDRFPTPMTNPVR